MDEKYEHKVRKVINIITVLMLLSIVGYVVYSALTGATDILVFQILMGAVLVAVLLLADVVEPILLKKFKDITAERKLAYMKFLGLDILSVACLGYFIVTLGMEGSNNAGLYAAVGYFMLTRIKRKFKKEFEGSEAVEQTEEDKDN